MADIIATNAGAQGIRTVGLLLPFLGAAILTDVASRRVPNGLVAIMFAVGIGFQVWAADTIGLALLQSFGGAAIGLAILLPFYMLGGMGAGDVKLLAAVGSFLGPHGALIAGIFTLGAGAVLGLVVIGCRCLRMLVSQGCLAAMTVSGGASVPLPYSLAISMGAVMAVLQ